MNSGAIYIYIYIYIGGDRRCGGFRDHRLQNPAVAAVANITVVAAATTVASHATNVVTATVASHATPIVTVVPTVPRSSLDPPIVGNARRLGSTEPLGRGGSIW
jgi:hypothetical protein